MRRELRKNGLEELLKIQEALKPIGYFAEEVSVKDFRDGSIIIEAIPFYAKDHCQKMDDIKKEIFKFL
jgi:hypothetical protein